MRLAVKFTKEAPVRFVSHLDVLRLFQRAFRRAKLPLAYSMGFNPHPLVSFAAALSVGYTSLGEYLDLVLTEDMPIEEFKRRVSAVLPEGIRITEVFDLGDSRKSLTSAMRTADYKVKAVFGRSLSREELDTAAEELLSREIVVMKKTKGGIKPTDIRPMVVSLAVSSFNCREAEFELSGILSAEGGLNPDMLMAELFKKLSVSGDTQVERTRIVMDFDSVI